MDEAQKDTRTLGERLAAVAKRVSYLVKDGTNDHHHYKYVTEASVKRQFREAFEAEGLVLYAVEMELGYGSTPTAATVTVKLAVGPVGNRDEQWSWFSGVGGDHDKSGKAVMKAEAAAIKYALTSMALVPTGDDPEANKEADAIGRGEKRTAVGGGRRGGKRAMNNGDVGVDEVDGKAWD